MREVNLQKIVYIIDAHCRSVSVGLTARSAGPWAVEGGVMIARPMSLNLCRYRCV